MASKSNNLIDRTEPTFWTKQVSKNLEEKQDNSGTNTQHSPSHTEKKTNLTKEIQKSKKNLVESEKVTPITSHTQFHSKQETPANKHLSICDPPQTKEKTNWYKSGPTAIALCLCLALLPFIKNINRPENSNKQAFHPVESHPSLRGIASKREVASSEEEKKLLTERYEAKKERLIQRRNRDNQKAIHVLKGQRRLASVGRKPSIKDNFSHELLHFRYRVKWRRNKLSYFNLLEGKEPISHFKIEEVIKNYSSLFPTHDNIQEQSRDMAPENLALKPYTARIEKKLNKNGFFIAQMETYTLQDKGSPAATVTVFTDDNGRLLALYVK